MSDKRGTKKGVGVELPATLTFNTGVPEIMETVADSCRYRLKGKDWKTYTAGASFKVPGEPCHYVCHFE